MKRLALCLSLVSVLALASGCIQRVETPAAGASSLPPSNSVKEVAVKPDPADTKTTDLTPSEAKSDPTDPPPPATKETDPKAADTKTGTGRPPVDPRPAKQGVNPGDKDKPYDITFDTIKFDIEKDQKFEREMLTKEIEALVGQRVKLRGYMLPSFQQTGIVQFILVRDNMECCFGPGAAIYDCVLIEMQDGQTTDYQIRPVTVDGYFDIKPIEQDGKLLVLFKVRGLSVR